LVCLVISASGSADARSTVTRITRHESLLRLPGQDDPNPNKCGRVGLGVPANAVECVASPPTCCNVARSRYRLSAYSWTLPSPQVDLSDRHCGARAHPSCAPGVAGCFTPYDLDAARLQLPKGELIEGLRLEPRKADLEPSPFEDP
jgi:hypothetical protein